MIFDTHTHYDDDQFEEDRDSLLLSLKENGVGAVANMGASMRGAKDSVALAKKYPFVYAAVGIHPDHAKELNEEEFETLKQLAAEEKVVAIGEIGLDYYWDATDREDQKYWFKRQLALARELSTHLKKCRTSKRAIINPERRWVYEKRIVQRQYKT